MARSGHIPAPAARRLSLYLRQLEEFQANERETVSSKQLGESLNLSGAQIRKDLAYFGQFGYPGVGYRVAELIARVRRILGTDKKSKLMIVGVGNLGRALLSFRGFEQKGFDVVAAFDNDPQKIGGSLDTERGIRVQPLDEMRTTVKQQAIRLGVLTVPAAAAQSVAEAMVAAGIRGILNFAPLSLQVAPHVQVASVDLAVQVEQLSFRLNDAAE